MLSFSSSLIFVVLVAGCAALSVEKVSDGKIETFLEPVKLQGISFTKRYMNTSVPTMVKFNVTTTVASDDLALSWLFDGAQLNVLRFKGPLPDNPGTAFSTELQGPNSVEITLHLRDKSLSAGNYTLVVSVTTEAVTQSAQASGFVRAAPILPLFPKDRRVLEGDRLLISCEVIAFPKPDKVIWRFAPIKPDMMKDPDALVEAKADLTLLGENSSDYQFLTKSVPNDQLLFPQLPSAYNGLYECSVGDRENGDESLILVNVKDRWAALWPFIGIVIEVAVLVTAILLYERHQMRSKPLKVDANAAATAAATATEASSPGMNPRTTQMQQQNNVNAVGEPNNETTVDGNKGLNTEASDNKTDELRLRGGVARC
ncbi:Basigin [Clonorchis sinensis]|uniref:Basigin n=1 Tax=Clonorchis sinensis TaxID=79923 RepID=A0A8T1MZ73_CLOSI|nr:Basigin [Clonorchis sinensis]